MVPHTPPVGGATCICLGRQQTPAMRQHTLTHSTRHHDEKEEAEHQIRNVLRCFFAKIYSLRFGGVHRGAVMVVVQGYELHSSLFFIALRVYGK